MTKLSSLCVYCGSSNGIEPFYRNAAYKLGRLCAENGTKLVYGGGKSGLMGAVADGALEAGGRVHGIIPRHLEEWELVHPRVQNMEIVESMHVRKMRMYEEADAFCVLPGGLGTLDETFEMATWHQLGMHEKPIIVVNLNGYWDPLIALVERQSSQGFVRSEHLSYFKIVRHVDDVIATAAGTLLPGASSTRKSA